MPARSLGTIAAAISRHVDGQVPFGEIVEAINNANQEIHDKYEWPWTRAESLLAIKGTYTAGKISVADGSASVTGTSTAWDTSWAYKRMLIGSNAYLVSAFTSPTTATLVQAVNQGQSFTNVGYTVFQDMYALPTDCEPAKEILIVNPQYRYRLRYIPVYTLERQNVWLPGFFSNFQMAFSDGGYDDTNHVNLIRMTPPPSADAQYVIVYRRRVPDLGTLAGQTLIPPSYDRVVELMAEYLVRLNRKTPMPGWMEVKQEAYQLLQTMRRGMATAMVDNYAAFTSYPASDNLSFYANGVYVGPTQ